MKRAWQLASAVFLAFSAFVLYTSFEYRYFDRLGPGPGFFPLWLSGIAAVLSAVLFLQVTLGRVPLPSAEGLIPTRAGARRVLLILAGLVAALVLLEPLGFRLTMLAFMLFLPLALGIRNYVAVGALAVAGSFGVFHLFYYVLKLPLPMGIFGI
jgi:putative tricarboxylic transport membrane protein